MNVPSMGVSKEHAQAALKEYKQHRNVYDRRDWEIERIYRQIANGKRVISAFGAIQQAGVDERKRPRLAIARADCLRVRCWTWSDHLDFDDPTKRMVGRDGRWLLKVPFTGVNAVFNLGAIVPRIPPQHRPAQELLDKYHILWEADWHEVPKDPYLLRRIGKDAWIVLAAWDLTEVELSVLRAHDVRQ